MVFKDAEYLLLFDQSDVDKAEKEYEIPFYLYFSWYLTILMFKAVPDPMAKYHMHIYIYGNNDDFEFGNFMYGEPWSPMTISEFVNGFYEKFLFYVQVIKKNDKDAVNDYVTSMLTKGGLNVRIVNPFVVDEDGDCDYDSDYGDNDTIAKNIKRAREKKDENPKIDNNIQNFVDLFHELCE